MSMRIILILLRLGLERFWGVMSANKALTFGDMCLSIRIMVKGLHYMAQLRLVLVVA